MEEYVFVYGTLKQGYWNNRLIMDSEFLGEATTLNNTYVMSKSGIPFVRRATERDPREVVGFIKGEVYKVTNPHCMADLDRLEGHPTSYRREKVPITISDGSVPTIDCWVYLYNHDRVYNESMYVTPDENGRITYNG